MTDTQSETHDKEDEEFRAHLADIKDGCGCTEIWEHTSEQRDATD